MQTILKKEFVAAWVDTQGDDAAGGSFAHDPEDSPGSCVRGNGRSNLQMLVLSPDGGILHAMAGFVPHDELLVELRYALDTFALAERSGDLAREAVRLRHEELLAPEDGLVERLDLNELSSKGEIDRETMQRLMNQFRRDNVERDREFVRKHPLLPIGKFETSMLSGGGISFFGSSAGDTDGDLIGNTDGVDADFLKRIRERAEEAGKGTGQQKRRSRRSRDDDEDDDEDESND